jgi:hypothetical protein
VAEIKAETGEVTLSDVVVELRAIRAMLEQHQETTAMCPHGSTGICMACVTPLVEFHLSSLVNQITNEVWAAMRRG